MVDADLIHVEVAYALPDHQVIVPLEVAAGTTVEEAIHESGILETFTDIDLSRAKVGVFGKLTKLSTQLRPRDRVEIYRPLLADPKEARKRRALEHKAAAGDEAN